MPRPNADRIVFSVQVPVGLDSTFRVHAAAKRLRLNEAIAEAVTLFIEANHSALEAYDAPVAPAGAPVA
jgi:hypothetical protein